MTNSEIHSYLYQGLSLYREGKRSEIVVTKKDGTVIEGVVIHASDPMAASFGKWEIVDSANKSHIVTIKQIESAKLFQEK